MSSAVSPADARAYILERLVGETGEPDKVTKAAQAVGLRTVEGMADSVNQHLSFPLEFELGAVELARMGDALAKTAENAAVAMASSPNSPDALLLDMDGDGVSLIVGAFLGADPEFPSVPIKRPLTDIEIAIMKTVLEEVAASADGPDRALRLHLPIPAPITGADIAKHLLRDGPAVRICITLRSPASSGQLVLTLPQRVLKDAGKGDGGRDPSGQWSARLGDEVRKSSVVVEALVPVERMSLGAISALQIGQVLEMPVGAKSETKLLARNKELFVCEFGKLGTNYSVRIRHSANEDQDLAESLFGH